MSVPLAGRPLLVLALLAGCAAPPPVSAPPPTRPPAAPRSGLDADQTAALRALGVPVLVPADPAGWALDGFEAGSDATGSSYILTYRRGDGACVEVSGTTDRLEAPRPPIVSTEARIAALGRTVRVYQAADDPGATSAQVWGPGTVVADVIDLDGTAVLVLSDAHDGCRPVSLLDGADFVSRLAPLGS